jgi:hypothetical protein
MNRVTIDHNTSEQLGAANQPVQIVDETGRLLGHFVPTASLHPPVDCPYSDDQLAEMRADPGGRPLHQIWESLDGK